MLLKVSGWRSPSARRPPEECKEAPKPTRPETEACTLPPADPSVGGPTGAAAGIQVLAEERLGLLQPALVLQHRGEVVDAVQGDGMPVSQHGAAWGTLQQGEDFRLQEAS